MAFTARDETAESVSPDQILMREREQETTIFLGSADHEQDWQPHSVDLYSDICDDRYYMYTAESPLAQ